MIPVFFLYTLSTLVLIQVVIQPAKALFEAHYLIQDLELANMADFIDDASYWALNDTNAQKSVQNCNSNYFLQVYQLNNAQTALSRTYYNLQTHTAVSITLEFWMLGPWTGALPITFQVIQSLTNVISTQQIINGGYSLRPSQAISCNGNPSNSLKIIPMKILSAHTGSNLTLRITTDIADAGASASQNRFYGIRNLQILLSTNSMATSECVFPPSTGGTTVDSSAETCRCQTGQYYTTANISNVSTPYCSSCYAPCKECRSSTCYSCASGYTYSGVQCANCYTSCQTCLGVTEFDCLTCKPGKYLYWSGQCLNGCTGLFTMRPLAGIDHCDPPCNNGTDYLYINQTCNETCVYPFSWVRDRNGTQHCHFRCESDPGGKYLYANNTCLSTCPYAFQSLVQGVETYCNCNPPYYFYWNGTCLPTCPFPLTSFQNETIRLCTYPCQTTEYLYWNGSCLSTCSLPYKIKTDPNNLLYCYSDCLFPQYLFLNGSCGVSCPSPIPVVYNYGVMVCQPPCSNSSWFYYPDIKNCSENCTSRRKSNSSDFYKSCFLVPLDPDSEEFKAAQALASLGNTAGTASTIGLTINNAVSPGDPGSISAGAMGKLLQYAKYLNITYTLKLNVLFQLQNASGGAIKFAPKMPSKWRQNFPNLTLPYKFTKYQVSSNFIVNFWDNSMSLLIFAGALGLVRGIEWLAAQLKKKYFPPSLMQLVRILVQNFVLSQFYNSFGDIVLFSALDFRTNHLTSKYHNLSFFYSILFITLGLGIIYLHFSILQGYQSTKQTRSDTEISKFQKENSGLKVFFISFRDETFFSQAYLLFFILRIIMANITIAILFQHPLEQAFILMGLTLVITLYLLFVRPFKSIVNLLQQLVFEVTILVFNSCLVGLALLDTQSAPSQYTREKLSDIMLMCSLALSFIPMIFLVIKVIVAARDFYLMRKAKKLKDARVNQRQLHTLDRSQTLENLNKNYSMNQNLSSINDNSMFYPTEATPNYNPNYNDPNMETGFELDNNFYNRDLKRNPRIRRRTVAKKMLRSKRSEIQIPRQKTEIQDIITLD